MAFKKNLTDFKQLKNHSRNKHQNINILHKDYTHTHTHTHTQKKTKYIFKSGKKIDFFFTI